jgi:hypothetical protein
MSDVLPAHKLGPPRPLSDNETALIKKLLSGTPSESKGLRQLSKALVQDMSDGNMGSIRFCNPSASERRLGKVVTEGSFRDADGVLVSVTLNADQFGDLFELDLWKVDFSPLKRFPKVADVEMIKRPGKPGRQERENS